MRGLIQFGKLRKNQNSDAIKAECIHRGIDTTHKGWKAMIEAIRTDELENWKRDNPNQSPPINHRKYFRSLSGTSFLEVDN